MESSLNTTEKKTSILTFSNKIKSVLLVDSNEVDIFVNSKILKLYGVADIVSFTNANDALLHLKSENAKYQLILIDIYLPVIDGFGFIDKFNELDLRQTKGEICILSASVDPQHRKNSLEKNIRFIEKPLTIQNLHVNF